MIPNRAATMAFRLSTRCTVTMSIDPHKQITCTWQPSCPEKLTGMERRGYAKACKAMERLAEMKEQQQRAVYDRSEAE